MLLALGISIVANSEFTGGALLMGPAKIHTESLELYSVILACIYIRSNKNENFARTVMNLKYAFINKMIPYLIYFRDRLLAETFLHRLSNF